MLNSKHINRFFFIVIIGFIVINFYYSIPLLLFVFLMFSWLVITSIGSFHIRWNYHLKALHQLKQTKKKQIAISFDDGPNQIYTPKILALLKQHNAKATFFCIGKHIEAYPEIIKQINNNGHTLGNHTFSHSSFFGFFKTNSIVSELNQTDTKIKTLIGKKPLLFRPPFGVTNPFIAKAIKITKHTVIGWNIRSLDTVINSEQKILNRITKRIQPGAIILLHDTSEKSVAVLEQLLLFLQEEDYQAVTINELFNIEAYA